LSRGGSELGRSHRQAPSAQRAEACRRSVFGCGEQSRLRVLMWCLVAAWSFTSSAAFASGLDYEVVEGCPKQSQFEEQLGDDCALESLDMQVAVQREGTGFRLKLLVESADARYPEQKSAQRCEHLIELAAHVARLVCQPRPIDDTSAGGRPTQLGSALTPATPAARSSTSPGPAATTNDHGTADGGGIAAALWRRPWMAAGALAQSGTSPGLDAAVALDLGIELGTHSLALGVAGWLPRQLQAELDQGNRTTLQLNRLSVQLQDCVRDDNPTSVAVGGWGLGACLNLGYQIVSSHFPAGTQPRDYRSWPTAGASFSALTKLTEHLVVEGQLGFDVNIAASPVTAEPFGVAHEFGPVAGFAGTRVIWAFERTHEPAAVKSDQTRRESRELSGARSLTVRNAW